MGLIYSVLQSEYSIRVKLLYSGQLSILDTEQFNITNAE